MPDSASAPVNGSTPASPPPVKRMRLGTKSCAECRRRKVKCNVQPGNDSCDDCIAHDVTCRPQDGARTRPSATGTGATTTASSESENDPLNRRLAHLESLLNGIVDARQRSDDVLPSPTATTASPQTFGPAGSNASGDQSQGDASLHNTPFSHVWQDVMTINPVPSSNHIPNEPNPPVFSHLVPPPLPGIEALNIILSYTEKFWPLWPKFNWDTATIKQLVPGDAQHNVTLIQEAIGRQDHVITPKAYLFLALCLMHLPRRHATHIGLPYPTLKLIALYQARANALLSSVLGDANSHALVCHALQWQLHFDMGNPIAAWRCLRVAITLAIQLGYHHASVSYNSDIEKGMWTSLWQNERQIACIVGLPSCTSNTHVGCRIDDLDLQNATELEIIHHELSIINGKIIDRDQSQFSRKAEADDYSTTMRIDPELEDILFRLRPSMLEHLTPASAATHTFAEIFFKTSTLMRVYTVQKLLHMPYMLRATRKNVDPGPTFRTGQYYYRRSFKRAVEAARNIITTFSNFRDSCEDFMCDVMDFQAFSAAMVLIIAILTSRKTHNEDRTGTSVADAFEPLYNPSEEDIDWKYITTVARCLRQTDVALNCQVARQGADTLDALIAACVSSTQGAKNMRVSIPYFGRVEIKLPAQRPVQRNVAPKVHSPFGPNNLFPVNEEPSTHSLPTPASMFNPENLPLATGYAQPLSYDPISATQISIQCNELNAMASSFSFGDELRGNWFLDAESVGSAAPDFADFDWMQNFSIQSTFGYTTDIQDNLMP